MPVHCYGDTKLITLLSRRKVVDIMVVISEIKAEQEVTTFHHDIAVVTDFCNDITSCNSLSNSERQTATGCRHDRSKGAYVLLPEEESAVS